MLNIFTIIKSFFRKTTYPGYRFKVGDIIILKPTHELTRGKWGVKKKFRIDSIKRLKEKLGEGPYVVAGMREVTPEIAASKIDPVGLGQHVLIKRQSESGFETIHASWFLPAPSEEDD
jgi:hypothetical protein